MPKQTLFADDLSVYYGQFTVEPTGHDPVEMEKAFVGQSNGICGAGQTGALFLVTGLHTGSVHLTVELADAQPPVDAAWEEVVECSLTHEQDSLLLCEWAHEAVYPLAIPAGQYRVRYSAKAMVADEDGDGPQQTYLLQFWPATPHADVVLRATGKCAAYWHAQARK